MFVINAHFFSSSRSRCESPGKSARLLFRVEHERARGRAISSQVTMHSSYLLPPPPPPFLLTFSFFLDSDSLGYRSPELERFEKRNIDEIDRTAFDNFFKRNLDEIDRVGWSGFVKRLANYLGHRTSERGPAMRRFGWKDFYLPCYYFLFFSKILIEPPLSLSLSPHG